MTLHCARTVLAGSMTLLLGLSAHAWSAAGHRVVARIADAHLTPKAKAAVAELLNGPSMVEVAPWMDRARKEPKYRFTTTWHWVTIPDGLTYDQIDHKPEGDIVEAIGRMVATLKSDTASTNSKAFAVRCLVHMVGDLHQPLHVGNGLDKGGNDFQVRWKGRGTNLHHVWDDELIKARQPDEAALADQLRAVTKRQKRAWQRGSPMDWAHECMAFRTVIYPDRPGVELGADYVEAHWTVVTGQLQKAGVRLAWLLNSALG